MRRADAAERRRQGRRDGRLGLRRHFLPQEDPSAHRDRGTLRSMRQQSLEIPHKLGAMKDRVNFFSEDLSSSPNRCRSP